MSFPLPLDPRAARRARTSRWLGLGLALILVALLAYFGYLGYRGSGELVDRVGARGRLPHPCGDGLGLRGDQLRRRGRQGGFRRPRSRALHIRSAPAGGDLTTEDGIRIAGWYIPAAGDLGPKGATVVLLHGSDGNKSEMLGWAAVLHETYNVLAFDLRNHGQSSGGIPRRGRSNSST